MLSLYVGKTAAQVVTDGVTTAKNVLLAAVLIFLISSVSYAALFLGKTENTTKPATPINVACVGDSITEWSGYPADLQALLGDDYSVGNFGVAESAVSANWFKPYINQTAFQEAKDFKPSIIVIMLGTNDAHTHQSTSSFASDYKQLISEYNGLDSQPRIYLVKPPPIYENKLELSGTNLQEDVLPSIEQVANEFSLPVVDVNSALTDHPEYFADGVHPNSEGAMVIANEIWEALTINEELTGLPMDTPIEGSW
jgi:lysophospholipase L1-like esterase